MGIKTYKPTSPGRRDGSVLDYKELTTTKPEKSLLRPLKKSGGRNNRGRITSRRRGGGNKRRYRVIDCCGKRMLRSQPIVDRQYSCAGRLRDPFDHGTMRLHRSDQITAAMQVQ